MRLYTTHKHAVIWLLITGALVAFLTASPLPGVSYLGIAPVVFPVVLVFSSGLAGILPTIANLILMLLGAYVVFGVSGLWFALYLLPMVIVFQVCLEKKLPFFKTGAMVFVAMAFSMTLLFVLLQRMAGGALYSAAAKAAIKGLDSLTWRDDFLYMLLKTGFISHGFPTDDQALIQNVFGGWTFRPEVLSEFYKQIDSRLVALLSAYFPSLLTGFSLMLSFPVTGFAVKLGKRYGTSPSLGMPPFSAWYLPKAFNPALIILAAGYLLSSFSNQVVLGTAGELMYNVFSTVALIQGLALLNFFLKRRGSKPFVRFAALIMTLLLLPMAALFLGIFDQLSDPRKLRASKSLDPFNDRT